jgi:glycosyltransferase involved in cell wall biosynthesis
MPGYRAAMLACDAVCVPSRDDTLPLVSLDALGAGRVLMCTATTGTAAYLADGTSGFVAAAPDADAIAAMLARAVADRARWEEIAADGRAVFDRAFGQAPFLAILDDAVRWASRR